LEARAIASSFLDKDLERQSSIDDIAARRSRSPGPVNPGGSPGPEMEPVNLTRQSSLKSNYSAKVDEYFLLFRGPQQPKPLNSEA